MNATPDPVLTAWAAACTEHAVAQLAGFGGEHADAAVLAARAWAEGDGSADACRDAAFGAHLAARELQDAGYDAAAAGLRAASLAAGSVDDAALARTAADYAVDALTLNSAPCELQFNAAAERRWQWLQLPPGHRPLIFAEEPAPPTSAACAIIPE